MQNIVSFYAPTISTQGVIYAAMKNAQVAFVDVRDIGAVAAKVLTSDGHAGNNYVLTGPEALTYDEVAESVGKLLGRSIQYVDVPPTELRKSMLATGMPEWLVDALLELQAYYANGPGGKVTSDVRRILGRDPISLDQFLRDYAPSFGVQAATASWGANLEASR
jgi:uncharacterized protein YbjT (DUF2867 family)